MIIQLCSEATVVTMYFLGFHWTIIMIIGKDGASIMCCNILASVQLQKTGHLYHSEPVDLTK